MKGQEEDPHEAERGGSVQQDVQPTGAPLPRRRRAVANDPNKGITQETFDFYDEFLEESSNRRKSKEMPAEVREDSYSMIRSMKGYNSEWDDLLNPSQYHAIPKGSAAVQAQSEARPGTHSVDPPREHRTATDERTPANQKSNKNTMSQADLALMKVPIPGSDYEQDGDGLWEPGDLFTGGGGTSQASQQTV